MTTTFATRHLANEAETATLARTLGTVLGVGDVLLLEGMLGAGKSYFARHVIQSLLGTPEDIPSPTFTLVQTYETQDFDIWHCDLYRITDPEAAIELGLDEAFETAACLIEWPSRLGALTPKDAVTLTLEGGAEETARIATFSGIASDFRERLSGVLND